MCKESPSAVLFLPVAFSSSPASAPGTMSSGSAWRKGNQCVKWRRVGSASSTTTDSLPVHQRGGGGDDGWGSERAGGGLKERLAAGERPSAADELLDGSRRFCRGSLQPVLCSQSALLSTRLQQLIRLPWSCRSSKQEEDCVTELMWVESDCSELKMTLSYYQAK